MNDIKINDFINNIKIEAIQTEYLREFIFKNINYRRKVRNDFVEALNDHYDIYHNYDKFPIYEFLKQYHNKETENGIYKDHCIGISEQVVNDLIANIKSMISFDKNAKEKGIFTTPSRFKFQKRDNYRSSFRVHCKPDNRNGKIYSRIKILNKNTIQFRVRATYAGLKQEYITLNLNEKIYDAYDENTNTYIRFYREYGKTHEYRFRVEDIKTIAFIHDLGKIYIQLSITGKSIIDKEEVKSRKKKCGIDTGIHNPFMLYDGDKYFSFRMSEKRSNKIHYLERKSRRLQSIMDKKLDMNKKLGLENPYSKNREKVRRKFRKIERKISNIKRDWSYKTCKWIVTNYQCIIVDSFEIPKNDDENLPKSVRRNLNYVNRFHRMYFTNRTLIHMANKYGCKYIEAPQFTTCRCSECGKINEHLPLGKRMFKCTKCGYTDDRDVNASKNCYNYI